MDNEQFFLGIELGSTRIKAVVINEHHEVIASTAHNWENKLEGNCWTYDLKDVWAGLRDCVQQIIANCELRIANLSAMGVSAMMHGYLAFGSAGNQLVPFRTWRNTTTGQASELLTERLGFHMPQRWSAAHLYQAILNGEPHVKDIAFMTTLAGYVHWKLTGEKVLGIGDASGMFPIDSERNAYHAKMLAQFNKLADLEYTFEDILPAIRIAGESAGFLTKEGARLLDPTGRLRPGIPLCPPEGDAGTGMVATNSVTERTGNVSAGTSIFAMVVLEQALSAAHREIDMVTTPSGKPVAMVHCNNCTSDIDAWIGLFQQVSELLGKQATKDELYDALYDAALAGEPDCGGMLSYNFYAGEPLAGIGEGAPLLCRRPDAKLTPGNFMRSLVFSAVASLRLGMDILAREGVQLDRVTGHGGFFKSRGAGQRLLAAALDTPVTVLACAGEGGAWGVALLAAYMVQKNWLSLEEYLEQNVFAGSAGIRVMPNEQDQKGFARYMACYTAGLDAVKTAADALVCKNT